MCVIEYNSINNNHINVNNSRSRRRNCNHNFIHNHIHVSNAAIDAVHLIIELMCLSC